MADRGSGFTAYRILHLQTELQWRVSFRADVEDGELKSKVESRKSKVAKSKVESRKSKVESRKVGKSESRKVGKSKVESRKSKVGKSESRKSKVERWKMEDGRWKIFAS